MREQVTAAREGLVDVLPLAVVQVSSSRRAKCLPATTPAIQHVIHKRIPPPPPPTYIGPLTVRAAHGHLRRGPGGGPHGSGP